MSEGSESVNNDKSAKLPENAPAFATGGGGFAIESMVCARVFLSILTGRGIPGLPISGASEVALQARGREWLFDDMVVTSVNSGTARRTGISVKSAAQFGVSSAPPDFVRLAWAQLLGKVKPSPPFNEATDGIGLACPFLDGDLWHQLGELLQEAAAQEPAALAEYVNKGGMSELRRKLYQSFACPTDIAAGHNADELHPGRLLRRLHFWNIDFRQPHSQSEDEAIALCREAVVDPEKEATQLWTTLCGLADELRPRAGIITLETLIDRICKIHALRDHPFYAPDLERLSVETRRQISMGKRTIGNKISLDLSALEQAVQSNLAVNRVLVLYGPSGTAKSHLARRAADEVITRGGFALWLPAGSINDRGMEVFGLGLGLTHSIAELVTKAAKGRRLLVVDSAEKLVSDSAFEELASALRSAVDTTEILITVTGGEVDRILSKFHSLGIPSSRFLNQAAPLPEPDKILERLAEFPEILRFAKRPAAANLLSRLKIADLLVSNIEHLRSDQADRIVGEATMADWFWNAVVDSSASRVRRSAFLKRFATRLADEEKSSVVEDELGGDEEVVDELIRAGLLARTDGRINFEHDLVADWTRYKTISSRDDDLPSYLRKRRGQVTWHTAVRLVAAKHIEIQAKGSSEWLRLIQKLEPDSVRSVHGDLVLDAATMALNGAQVLDGASEELFKDDGRLLRRLLARSLTAGTLPVEDLPRERIPQLNLLEHPVRYVLKHLDRVIALASKDACRLLAEWISWAPPSRNLTKEVASSLHKLARQYRSERKQGHYDRALSHECAPWIYRGCLASYAALPDQTRELLLLLAERRVEQSTKKTEIAVEHQLFLDLPRTLPDGSIALTPTCEWGPLRDVDSEFAKACSDVFNMQVLIHEAPALAAELIVATNVDHPREIVGYQSDDLDRMFGGRWEGMYPPMWFRGCFLPLLRRSPLDGIRAITVLCRHLEACFTLRSQIKSKGNLSTVQAGEIAIQVNGAWELWPGDQNLFTAYLDHGKAPDVVAVALMALEKYLYERLDAGDDITDLLNALLESGSVPIAGVLAAILCYRPQLAHGPLFSILTAGEVIAWDWERATKRQDKATFEIAWSRKGEAAGRLVHEWVSMPHRDRELLTVAQWVFARYDALKTKLAESASYWVSRYRDGRIWPSMFGLDRLTAFFDPANWQEKVIDGQTYLEFILPKEIAEADATEDQAITDKVFWLTASQRCLQFLETGKPLTAAAIQFLLKIEESIPKALPTDRLERQNIYDAAAGACACFLLLPTEGEPLSAQEKASWIRLLVEICNNPPASDQFDSERSRYPLGWDRFAARALGPLLAEDPASPDLRYSICSVLFTGHYEAITLMVHSIVKQWERFGAGFIDELWSLFIRFAAVSERLHRSKNRPAVRKRILNTALRWMDCAAADFAKGSTSKGIPTKEVLRKLSGRSFWPSDVPVVDSGVIGAICIGMLGSHQVAAKKEIVNWHAWWTAVTEWSTERARWQMHQKAQDDDGGRRPEVFGDDEHVIETIARIAAAVDDDSYASTLWQPIFESGPDWVEHFLGDWLTIPNGVYESDRYLSRWREIIQAASLVESNRADLQAAALGINQIGPQYWSNAEAKLMTGIADLFSVWLGTAQHTMYVGLAARMLRWDACQDLRVIVLRPMLETIKRLVGHERLRHDDGSEVASYAKLLRERHREGAGAQWQSDLRELIDLLASHHIQSAVDLQQGQ